MPIPLQCYYRAESTCLGVETMVTQTGRLIPAPRRHRWAVNYDDGPYVQIPPWNPRGSFTISFDINSPASVLATSHVFGRFSGTEASFNIGITSGGKWRLTNQTTTISTPDYISGFTSALITVEGGNLVFRQGDTEFFNVTALPDGSYFVDTIGANRNAGATDDYREEWTGQISNFRLTDLQDPTNSRYYPGVINSAVMPDSGVLVDVLDSGIELIDFENPVSANNEFQLNSEGFYDVNGSLFSNIEWNIPLNNTNSVFYIEIDAIVTSGALSVFIRDSRGNDNAWFAITVDSQNENIQRNFRLDNFTGSNPQIFIECTTGVVVGVIRRFSVVARTDGIITNPDANQPYVPLLAQNQHYLSGNDDGDFSNGIDTTNNMMTSAAGASNLAGSWSGNQPAVGSLLSSNNAAIVRVTAHTGNDQITYAVEQGTTEQIQLGYQYPEVFTVTPP